MKQKNAGPILRKIDKILIAVSKGYMGIGLMATIAIMLIAVADAVAAKCFGSSVPYGNALITYLSVPTAFSAIAYTQLCESHVNIEILYRHFPRSLKVGVKIFNCFVCGAICGAVAWYGGRYAINRLSIHATSGNPGFVIWPFVAFLSVSFALLAIAYVWSIVRIIADMDDSFDKQAVKGVIDMDEYEEMQRRMREDNPNLDHTVEGGDAK